MNVNVSNSPCSSIRRRRTITVITILMLVILFATAWLAYRANRVSGALARTLEIVEKVPNQVSLVDSDELARTSTLLQEQTAIARSGSSDPVWRAAGHLPFIGRNFSAITELSIAADELVANALVPLVDSSDSLEAMLHSDKGTIIDTALLRDVAPNVVRAADTVELSYDRVALIETHGTVSVVSEAVESAKLRLNALRKPLTSISSAATLLPDMLGNTTSREYLLLIQNNAEVRATGGISGALAIIRAEEGRLELVEQSTAVSVGVQVPPLKVDSEQESIYTRRLGAQMQNVNLTPDFPTAATTAKAMWESHRPEAELDGVLALDPVALSYLMKVSGSVELKDPELLALIADTTLPRTLTEANIIPTLLSDIYLQVQDPHLQDAYFAGVASSIFMEFTSGGVDILDVATAINMGVVESRILMWSNHSSEQAVIAPSPIGGRVGGAMSKGATFGVYFNDGTGAKMDYYARRTAQLVQACPAGEYSQYTVRVRVSNNAPLDTSLLPAYVTGNGAFGVAPGRIRTNYVFYGPAQAFADSATINGTSVPVGSGKHGQRPVGTVSLELGPGETAVLEMTFSHVVQDSEPQIQMTPTIQSSSEVILPFERVPCE